MREKKLLRPTKFQVAVARYKFWDKEKNCVFSDVLFFQDFFPFSPSYQWPPSFLPSSVANWHIPWTKNAGCGIKNIYICNILSSIFCCKFFDVCFYLRVGNPVSLLLRAWWQLGGKQEKKEEKTPSMPFL